MSAMLFVCLVTCDGVHFQGLQQEDASPLLPCASGVTRACMTKVSVTKHARLFATHQEKDMISARVAEKG